MNRANHPSIWLVVTFHLLGCSMIPEMKQAVDAFSVFPEWLSLSSANKDDERGYFQLRDNMLASEREYEQRKFSYSQDEVIVNNYLEFLKWREQAANMSYFLPSRPIEQTLTSIKSSEMFAALKDLPKGGNLHSHENHQLGKRKLFEIVWSMDEFQYLHVVQSGGKSRNEWNTDFFVNPPTNEAWVKVKNTNLTIDDLVKQNTLINIMSMEDTNTPTDSANRWAKLNHLWSRAGSQILANYNLRKKYLLAMYNESYNEGITYIESRRAYDNILYVMDPSGANSATYGKKYLGADFSIEIQVALDAAKEFSDKHPRFIGHKAIGYASRSKNETVFQRALNKTLKMFQSYPQHMIGFDAVGEEDAGYSSLKFIHEYLTNFQKGGISVPLYLHSVETNWPIDLMTYTKDDDIVPTLENAYESILLAAKRVGHGKGFLKMPYLRQIMKERKVAVEACVVSNQILGYDPDLRNHFAQVYHKEGIPIVLAPDDPGTMGYDTVVVDWYIAYVGWGLELGDLKKIALNSLVYNGLTDAERNVAVEQKWRPSWNEYITKMKNIACTRDFAGEAAKENRTVKFVRLLPTEGYESGNVHVYGRNFEVAICKVAKCRFESIGDVNAIYISDRHIVCPAPKCPACAGKSTKVSLKVALDGDNYRQTNLDFTLAFASGNKNSFVMASFVTIIFNLLNRFYL